MSNERIRLRAYYLWLAAGGVHGSSADHWLEAEKQEAAGGVEAGTEIPLEIKYQDPA